MSLNILDKGTDLIVTKVTGGKYGVRQTAAFQELDSKARAAVDKPILLRAYDSMSLVILNDDNPDDWFVPRLEIYKRS